MARFHFYAPYIKVLRNNGVKIDNLEPLAAYSKNNELLPNLVGLECQGIDLHTSSIFLSGLTREVTIGRPLTEDSADSDLDDPADPSDSDGSDGSDVPKVPRKGLGTASTRQLMERAAHKCPNLRSLEFYPEYNKITDPATSLQTFSSFSSFKHLRRLVSTPAVIQSTALQLIAQLPNLHTLSIEPSGHSGHWDPSLCEQIPAGSFPALTDLTLRLKESRDAKQFWELVPLRALKNLSLTIIAPSDNGEPQFIPALCRSSPLITKLKLKFRRVHTITADVFEHLARLPIESCSFVRASLDFEGAWAKIAGSWPELRFIKCSHKSARLDDLLLLSSSLPKLENIYCHFDLDYAAINVKSNWLPAGRPPFYPNLKHLNPTPSNFTGVTYGREFRGLAKFIAYFWPKLTIRYAGRDQWEGYSDSDEKDLRRMIGEIVEDKEAMFVMFEELILAYLAILVMFELVYNVVFNRSG
ncbi:hypothetical protein FRC10_003862 [Ceratobasidium sp. 414]|nr:hypothetical protein FRC10_003862 [Ceratobasidium sp. 414]